MGASSWIYFVPYQQDFYAALEQLRQDVFQRGDYLLLDDWDLMNEADERIAAGEDPTTVHTDQLKQRAALPKPDSIDELFEWNEDSGTHSILDMEGGLSDEVGFGTLSPLTDDQLLATFGTTMPTHQQVEQRMKDDDWVGDLRSRWQGLYLVIYDGNSPSELCFAGYSGD